MKKLMKKAILTLSIALLIQGCSSTKVPQTVTPICRHYALFGALTWKNLTGQKTGIAFGYTKSGEPHVQAYVTDKDGLIIGWLRYQNGSWQLGKKDRFQLMEALDAVDYYQRVYNYKPGA